MGKIVKFDPKRRRQARNKWTQPAAYGVPEEPRHPPRAAGKPRRGSRVALAWLGIVAGCALWVLWRGGALG